MDQRGFLLRFLGCRVGGVALLPKELGGAKEQAGAGQRFADGASAPKAQQAVAGQPQSSSTTLLVETDLSQRLREVQPEEVKSFLAFLAGQSYSKSN